MNNAQWLDSLTEPPLLQYSPAAQFLASYFPDGVGLSPTLNDWKSKSEDSTGARFCFVLFYTTLIMACIKASLQSAVICWPNLGQISEE